VPAAAVGQGGIHLVQMGAREARDCAAHPIDFALVFRQYWDWMSRIDWA